MAVSKKQQACVHRYIKAHYDRLELATPAGMKDEIKRAADAQGQSVNAYIMQAVDARIQSDKREAGEK